MSGRMLAVTAAGAVVVLAVALGVPGIRDILTQIPELPDIALPGSPVPAQPGASSGAPAAPAGTPAPAPAAAPGPAGDAVPAVPGGAPDVVPAAPPPPPPPPPDPSPELPGWVVGDLHVHVSPPDAVGHSTLNVQSAIAASRRKVLDFVVLTPHYAHRNLSAGEWGGDRSLTGQEAVAAMAARYLAAPHPEEGKNGVRPILVVSGWEWTREDPGHLGVSFVDVATLAPHTGDQTAQRALAAGGLLVVNHPFFRPVDSDLPIMRLVTGDRRWRPFSGLGDDLGLWNAIEVFHDRSVWIEKMHAGRGAEFPDTQMVQQALQAWDLATLAGRRRITGVGGSDAHGKLPYTVAPLSVVSVYVENLDAESLRQGLLGARVTFGRDAGRSARDFTATSDVGERAGIGDSLRANESVTLTWSGSARLIENGMEVGAFDGGTTRTLEPPGGFAFWRIEKDPDAYSNMIYANLP